MFSVESALALCMANVNSRKSVGGGKKYVLFYGNDTKRYEGKVTGGTVKSLIETFRTSHGTYKYAFIVEEGNEEKVLRFYNRDVSKKFLSMTRTGVKRKKA